MDKLRTPSVLLIHTGQDGGAHVVCSSRGAGRRKATRQSISIAWRRGVARNKRTPQAPDISPRRKQGASSVGEMRFIFVSLEDETQGHHNSTTERPQSPGTETPMFDWDAGCLLLQFLLENLFPGFHLVEEAQHTAAGADVELVDVGIGSRSEDVTAVWGEADGRRRRIKLEVGHPLLGLV